MKLSTKLKVLGGIAVCIGLAGIYPVVYHYTPRAVPRLHNYTTYRIAVKDLSDSIRLAAKENHCRGYILPLDSADFTGPNHSLDFLRDYLNLALTNYSGWHLRVDAKERKEMISTRERILRKWGTMIAILDNENLDTKLESMNVQGGMAALDTKYSSSAEWRYLSGLQSNNVELMLSVNNINTGAKRFVVSQVFIHPDTLLQVLARRKSQQKRLANMQRLAHLSLKFVYGFTAIFLLTTAGFGVESLYDNKKRKRVREYLLNEISKREMLIDEGHYVTALELAEKYLKYFPDDTEIKAFKERLLDFTNNDPKAAQEAYVMAKKLRRRLEEHSNNPMRSLLSSDEESSVKALLPYHAELSATYNEIEKAEHQTTVAREMDEFIRKTSVLLERGEVYHALRLIHEKEPEFGDNPRWVPLRERAESLKRDCEGQFNDIKDLFNHGNIDEGVASLNKLTGKYKDHDDSQVLAKQIEEARGITKIKLTIANSRLSPIVVFKDSLTLGRKDIDKNPDVAFEDRRISRNHMTITLKAAECLVEDNGSTGGTYLNGERITSVSLREGDVLNLSRILEFRTGIFKRGNGTTGGLLLSGNEYNVMIVSSELGFRVGQDGLTTREPELTLYHQSTVPMIAWQDGFACLVADKEIHCPIGLIKVERI